MGLLGSSKYELLYGNNASDNKLGAKSYQFKKKLKIKKLPIQLWGTFYMTSHFGSYSRNW